MYGTYAHFQEHSPTSCATCQKCHETIKKGEPRVGDDFHYYRWNGIKWTHLKCVSLVDILAMLSNISNIIVLKIKLDAELETKSIEKEKADD